MSLVLESHGVGELDIDYSRATQLSTIGSMADAVLRELIIIELGTLDSDKLVAVPQAARIFRLAATQYAHRRTIWDAHSVLDDLVHFSSPGSDDIGGAPEPQVDDLQPWLVGLAGALESLTEQVPNPDAIDLVRREFTQISQSTMRSASRMVSGHTFLA
ncbi:hypothetical protein [Microbacterium sp. NPDC057650]|uniref:hypothetical protein n=1 Tax=unclassified Microbacterium TaxID=2609290 RepID=UPI00366DF131